MIHRNMTFKEAFEAANIAIDIALSFQVSGTEATVVALTLHPDGLWVVRYTLDNPSTLYERPLNL